MTRNSRLRLVGVALTALLGTALSGCSAFGDGVGGCSDAPSSVLDAARTTAQSGFRYGQEGNVISKVEVLRANSMPLPEDLQQFGATEIAIVWSDIYPRGNEDSAVPGVQGAAFFAAADDGTLIGPLDDLSAAAFDVSPPDDAGWSDWVSEVASSDTFHDALGCGSPN
ncbi:hypothetical protein [Nocardioides acrostichi]|uniref:Uncharacterized protein n=1 Tax=Nocardioides acrostichi TaxID=2784339 RepID=A0A930UX89_9ACTN|nr:hypothetical protein [Nocardioides acrostichi]MBF4161367.1 hypothetical protein [Nocardioides acrostichi]